jgi:hypothetical protein
MIYKSGVIMADRAVPRQVGAARSTPYFVRTTLSDSTKRFQ